MKRTLLFLEGTVKKIVLLLFDRQTEAQRHIQSESRVEVDIVPGEYAQAIRHSNTQG